MAVKGSYALWPANPQPAYREINKPICSKFIIFQVILTVFKILKNHIQNVLFCFAMIFGIKKFVINPISNLPLEMTCNV